MAGVKESLELLEGIKVLVVDGKKVLADGQINLEDLPVAMELLGQLNTLTLAVQGVGDIPKELGDLSQEEITTLVAKVFEIVDALKA